VAIHLIIHPLSKILISVDKHLVSGSFNFVFLELTLVLGAIFPYHDTFTVHTVLGEVSLVYLLALSEEVLSFSMELSINEVSLVQVAIEFELALTCLFSLLEISVVNDLIELP
jgi:hypothetical protein